jgi:RNA polymerase sigma factor (TIGR02999 family)
LAAILNFMHDVTRLLEASARGDQAAARDLLPAVYAELRRLATQKLAQERPGHTLQPTALVHEAYVRLLGSTSSAPESDAEPQRFECRAHFFAAAAEAMRRILVENARRKRRLKRGGERQRVDLAANEPAAPRPPTEDVLAVDEVLTELAKEDAAKAELVKLRFFAGLSVEEAAACLDISRATADRWWAYARAWLYERLR